jgi:hypothetical protein
MSKVKSKKPAKRAGKKAVRKAATLAKPSKAELLAKQVAREVAKREAIFKKASPTQKRVLIAKDVIAQIKAKKIKPESGTFVQVEKVKGFMSSSEADKRTGSWNYAMNRLSDSEGSDADVRQLYLDNTLQQCSCCALGGMFMSCTLYNNNTTIEDLEHAGNDISQVLLEETGEKLSNGLNKFFSVEQLKLIEQTFEGDNGAVLSGMDDDTGKTVDEFSPRAEAFYNKYKKSKDRLVAIMQNIVKNNGTFKP